MLQVVVAIVIIVIASAVGAAVRELADAALGNLSYGKILSNTAGAAVLTVGIFAALSQLEIAPAIVTGLFFALLAIVVGILIVSVGGGGIQPWRDKWGKALTRLDEEMPNAKRELSGAEDRVMDRAVEIRHEVRLGSAPSSTTT